MTDRELMQQSLEALEEMGGGYSQNLIAALRERLAQPETIIDKSAAIRIATALGWVPPGDTSQDRVDETPKQRHEQEPVAWVLEWIEDGEVYASKLYESERRCRYDAKKDTDAVCRPLVYGDTSQERVDEAENQRQEQEPGAVYGVGIEVGEFIPPRREWVGLTKEEAKEISMANRPYVVDMIAALEARLKEKNT